MPLLTTIKLVLLTSLLVQPEIKLVFRFNSKISIVQWETAADISVEDKNQIIGTIRKKQRTIRPKEKIFHLT